MSCGATPPSLFAMTGIDPSAAALPVRPGRNAPSSTNPPPRNSPMKK